MLDRLERPDRLPELLALPAYRTASSSVRSALPTWSAAVSSAPASRYAETSAGPPPVTRWSGVSGSAERTGSPGGRPAAPSTASASARYDTSGPPRSPRSNAVTTAVPAAAPGTAPAARCVATSGPGSSARPASSKTSTASGRPSPTPPSASGSRSAKNPAAPSSRHSSRSTALPPSTAARSASRPYRPARSSRTPARRSRWSRVGWKSTAAHRPFGRPRMRSATMLRWICEVPAAIVYEREDSRSAVHSSSSESESAPSTSAAVS